MYGPSLTDRGRDVAVQATARVRALQDELTAPLGGLASPATQALIESLRTLLDPTTTPGAGAMTTTPHPHRAGHWQAEKANPRRA